MSFLAQAFRQEMKKHKDPAMSGESTYPVGYPSTFLPFDYLNGMKIVNDVIGEDTTYIHYSIGFSDGSINSLIGKSGTAKSTFAVQAGLSIIAPFKNSVMIYDDVEGGMSLQRMQNVSGWSMQMLYERVIHRNVGISGENFFERLRAHCEQKKEIAMSDPDKIMYFTGFYDIHGKPVMKIIPTVYVLDSLALLVPQDLSDEEKVKGQMATTASAKLNAQIFRRIAPHLKAANVILFVVNHINAKVSLSVMPTAAQINYLGQDETVPGGFMALYLSNNILKFTASTKLKDSEGMGINGFISKVKLVKSRSSRAGREVPLVFNQERGFDRLLSNYQLLKDAKKVKGGGASFYIEGCEDIKFAQKNLYKKFYAEERLRIAMKNAVLEVCEEMVPTMDSNDEVQLTQNELAARLNDAFDEAEFE